MDTAKQSASPRTLDEASATGVPIRVRIFSERRPSGLVVTKVVPVADRAASSSPEEQPEKQREG